VRPGRTLVCVHAHPDDEAIWTGGLLARWADGGGRAAVVTCTDGEASAAGAGPADTRLAELDRALALLGAGPARLLGYKDSGLPATGDPASFWRADLDRAVGRLVGHLRELRPDVLVTYDAAGIYGHPDHIQAHRAALLAAEASGSAALYPAAGPACRPPRVYLVTVPRSVIQLASRELAGLGVLAGLRLGADPDTLGTPDDRLTTTVDVRPWLDRKWAAMRAHASQFGPGSPLDDVPEPLRAALLGTEWFVRRR
jgi:N-acetyl-1-D-myo-inositol-2-amino-2-deoxy-alpha-D-glucopyranoside deacetylase